MVLRSKLRNILLAAALCFLALPLFAQSAPSQAALQAQISQRQASMPEQLMLQASPGAKSGTYQDSTGRVFNVTPQDTGGTQCDPNGCMVQVCSGGACSYYYCTVTGCKAVHLPVGGAYVRPKEQMSDSMA
jgi:hypothetical protein